MADVLNVDTREELGSAKTRRLRQQGKIPAVLYGHGEENVHLALPALELAAAIRHGSQLVNLSGAVNESALIKAVQWDSLGSEVLHVDLTRVKAGETVTVTVSVELRGVAPGTKMGGVVNHALHSLEITCPATAIPEKLEVSVNSLELGNTLTVADIELPEGASTEAADDTLVAQCSQPTTQDEDEAIPGAADSIEPEVIGRSKEDEQEGADGG
ncbi:MAG TPA: 50S ribosomal protein L25 [Planctomycetaceae bacterium]|jgi:large subunit ribosomal protein L25|nr:50S ribosomal protein L25 [Blastopirellula sp.]HAY80060.1 50S ribosomal protein L25 [Planctomycetaceae bacterium]